MIYELFLLYLHKKKKQSANPLNFTAMIIWYTMWILVAIAVVTAAIGAVVGISEAIYDADKEMKAKKIDIPELLREMRAKESAAAIS
ncbi:MAG: hypothetical protein LBK18_06975 [Prevotellaceae bacterium]|nr:hypothetical protein [Prevotellaceae bacterium]